MLALPTFRSILDGKQNLELHLILSFIEMVLIFTKHLAPMI
jgi:hypothetical protein